MLILHLTVILTLTLTLTLILTLILTLTQYRHNKLHGYGVFQWRPVNVMCSLCFITFSITYVAGNVLLVGALFITLQLLQYL